jgi:ABC-2 type transport system permease protein
VRSTFLTLVKTQLNVIYGISALKYRFTKEKKKRWEPILIGVAIISGFGPLIALYTLMMEGVFSAGLSLGQPEIVITISFLLGQLIVLFFGIFYVMGAFYFAKDMNILIPLPLRPYQVLGSKFVVVMVNEYLTLLPILLPPTIIFGLATNQGLFYWFKSVLLILASPVIPLIAASLFIIILMRFINIRRSKDLLAVIGGALGIIFALGINLLFQRMPGNIEEGELIKNILEGRVELINSIGQKFPPSIWATLGLSRPGVEGFGYFLLFIGLSALLLVVLLWLGNLIFYKGYISGQEASRNRKMLNREEIRQKYSKSSSPVKAIFKREWKDLIRTPVYVLNGLVGSIIGPLILIFAIATPSQGEGIEDFLNLLLNPDYSLYVMLGGLGLMLFTAGMNVVASTAVSREGSTFWISKVIPVSPAKQVKGKFLHGYSISVIGILTTAVVLAVLLKFSAIKILILLLLGLIGAVALVALNLMVDVFRPKFEWNSPQEAMKQNMNGLFGMLVSLAVIAVLAGAAFVLIRLNAPEWLVYLILASLMVVMSIISYNRLLVLAERQYSKFEV